MSKLKKLAAAAEASKGVLSLDSTKILWLIFSGIAGLPFFALAGIALLVVILLVLMFSTAGASSTVADPSASGSAAAGGADMYAQEMGGDGTGTFNEAAVPDQTLVKLIEDAAKQCTLLTPVILAGMIEYASGFDPKKVGEEGRGGLLLMAPDDFKTYAQDDDNDGQISEFEPADAIYAGARYFCYLADQTQQLLDAKTITGDHLTETLMAWDIGLDQVKDVGAAPFLDLSGYAFDVRTTFPEFTIDASASAGAGAGAGATPTPTPTSGGDKQVAPAGGITQAQFEQMFPSRNALYTYAGLTGAMAKFPAFGTTGDATVKEQEIAAFLANVDHESGGLVYAEEVDKSGNYCDLGQPYGCPAGQGAYYGRGPIELSWNNNYKNAGDAIGVDLLNKPDLVATDATIAWETALWFWMTQTGAGTMTAHSAMTSGAGFGQTIRTINGAVECDGKSPARVSSRVDSYKRITSILGVDPGDASKLTC
jgi:predicted chitinase